MAHVDERMVLDLRETVRTLARQARELREENARLRAALDEQGLAPVRVGVPRLDLSHGKRHSPVTHNRSESVTTQ